MKTWLRTTVALSTLGLSLTGGAALAQRQEGLVNVNLSDIQLDIARDLDVNVSQIPITVQVPVGVAANVCNVSAAVLARQDAAAAPCDAESTSTALNSAVQRQLLGQ
jgi:hypothetical protein